MPFALDVILDTLVIVETEQLFARGEIDVEEYDARWRTIGVYPELVQSLAGLAATRVDDVQQLRTHLLDLPIP